MINNNKKDEIINIVMQYVDDGVLNITKFRKERPKTYAALPYYFGGINSLVEQLGLVKVQKSQQKNKVTLRNHLAYDMLIELRKTNTLEQIAAKYNVSRALVNQLYQALDLAIKIDNVKEALDDNA